MYAFAKIFRRCALALVMSLTAPFVVSAADTDGLDAATASNANQPETPHISAPDLRSASAPAAPAAESLAAVPPATEPAVATDSSGVTGTLAPAIPEPPAPAPVTAAPVSENEPPNGPGPLAANTSPDLPPQQNLPTDAGNAPPSKNVTINLINLMVKRGLITKDDAQGLIQQAQDEAAQAQAETPAGNETPPAAQAPTPAVPAGDEDQVQVNYVPDVVKNQIRDDVTASVMKQARDEHWSTNSNVPDWVHRFHVLGDIRVRTEDDMFPSGNDDAPGAFVNFNAINTGAPFDLSTISNPNNSESQFNVDRERLRFRLRARIGAGIDLADHFTAGIRIGTGQDNSPTTENQTLGAANNGQGGDFSKYAVWLDRGFLRYDLGDAKENFSVTVGRFDNPFLSSSMIWASEIGFDGIALQGNYQVADGVTPFLTAGFFPVFNTDFNFASDNNDKFESEDKYLYAAQLGTSWQITKDISTKTAAAFYYFDNIEGHLSNPFSPLSASQQGNTDDSRPSFAQNGNTYMELRDIVPIPANGEDTIDQYQYFGLATPFHEVAITSQIDYSRFDPFHIQLVGEFVDNVAFDRNAVADKAVNNRGSGGLGNFNGGNQGYNIKLTVGQPELQKLWDWNVTLTYRYVETDATVDGFTDADFGGPLVGTNLKGYIIGAYLGLGTRVSTSLRFLSADSIAGPTYHSDLIQLDVNAKF